MRSSAARRAAAALTAGALTACSTGPGDEPREEASSHVVVTLPPEPPGIRMSFLQQRIWEGTRRADVRIVNITDRTLAVRRIGLEWPGYPGRTQRFRATVAPGQTLDLHYRLPPPDCAADPAVRATGVAVTAGRTVRRPIDASGMRFLRRVWGAACARLRVDRTLSISYDVPPPSVAADIPPGGGLDSTLPVELRLTRRPAARHPVAVRLEDAQGTVLFDLTVRDPGAGLTPAQREGAVRLVVDPGRCDEHARSQATQPFAFRLWLRLGDGPEPVSVLAVPDKSAQLRLLEFLDLACAGRTEH